MAEIKGRLNDSNIKEYVNRSRQTSGKILSNFKPILQQNYGGANDCTLCSITAIQAYKEKYSRDFQSIYNQVEKVANRYYYNADDFGTIPFFIRKIVNTTFSIKSVVRYVKGLGYTWKNIKKNINNGVPMILSLWNDGRDYYYNHSVTVVGYAEFQNKKRLIVIYDNWYDTISYIDYDKLNRISCLNYF